MTEVPLWPRGEGEMRERIRALDWAGTPLGPTESWPRELKAVVELLLAQDFPMVLLCGSELIQIYNHGYAALMGDKHPAGLGAPAREVWPEVWAFNAPIYERVLAGETVTLTDQLFSIKRHGALENAWFSLCCSPARLADGRIGGVFISVFETTARLRQEAEREQRYRTLFQAMDEGFYYAQALFDEEGRCSDILYKDENEAAVRMIGQSAKGRHLSELGPYEDFWRETFGTVARTGEARRLVRYAAPDGIWFDFYAFKPAEAGPDEFAVIFQDVTQRKQAELKLRDSAERLRLILENARDYAIFTLDPEGRIDQWHAGAEAVYGWTAEEAQGQPVAITFTPEDRARGDHVEELENAAQNGSAPNVRWHIRKDGSLVFIDGVNMALRGEGGALQGFVKIGQNVTERRRAEEHQRTLHAELQHRVRNTLAIIRSIARRTAATSDTVEEMQMHLEGRLGAFSRVQAAVTRSPAAGVDLASLIEDELLAHAAREGEALEIGGPDLKLQARPAESISLAIHELATNAVKYGALSSERGRLRVLWERVRRENEEQLHLIWEENGVDLPGSPPERRGFGLELLTRTLPYDLRAETDVEFRREGVRFTMSVPLGPGMVAD